MSSNNRESVVRSNRRGATEKGDFFAGLFKKHGGTPGHGCGIKKKEPGEFEGKNEKTKQANLREL